MHPLLLVRVRKPCTSIISPRSGIGHTETHLMPGFMKLISIVAACVMLAPPTYQQCFEQYLRELQRINENEAYMVISHWEAVNQRLGAAQAYNACRDAAWEEWVRQWWRDTMDAIQ